MTQDIFNEANKVSGSFKKWEQIGDKVSGTYIGTSQKPDNYKKGEMQNIHEILTEDGNMVLIGGKIGIDTQMKVVSPGQIIGLEYVADKPSNDPSRDPAKIIQIYANKDNVNQEWLDANKFEEKTEESNGDEIVVEKVEFNDPSTTINATPSISTVLQSAPTSHPLDAAIKALVETKYGKMDEKSMIIKIMEISGMAFTDINKQAILEKLSK